MPHASHVSGPNLDLSQESFHFFSSDPWLKNAYSLKWMHKPKQWQFYGAKSVKTFSMKSAFKKRKFQNNFNDQGCLWRGGGGAIILFYEEGGYIIHLSRV